jgi:hypothetical protein
LILCQNNPNKQVKKQSKPATNPAKASKGSQLLSNQSKQQASAIRRAKSKKTSSLGSLDQQKIKLRLRH